MLLLYVTRTNQLLRPQIYIQQLRWKFGTSLLLDQQKYTFNRHLCTTAALTAVIFISNTAPSIPYNYISESNINRQAIQKKKQEKKQEKAEEEAEKEGEETGRRERKKKQKGKNKRSNRWNKEWQNRKRNYIA